MGSVLAPMGCVSRQARALLCLVTIAALLLPASACSPLDKRLQQHEEKFESLEATTAAVAEAWLAGTVSGTYARTALEQTFHLLEQEQSRLASSPQSLVDPRGAELSQKAERLSRLIAAMITDVRSADTQSARQRLAEIRVARAGDQR